MVKNKILTPVLAAVLGVTVAGSGVAYYFVNSSDSGKTESKKNTTALSDVKENITDTIDEAQKAVSGELDFAYDASVKMTFGEGITQKAGVAVAPVEFTTSTKQKGQNTEADFSVKYDDKALASLNAVYTRENNTAYIQVPELNSAYLSVTADGVKDSINSLLAQQGTDLSAIQSQMPSFENIDFDALEKDIQSYADTVKENIPEATAGDNLTGNIDGNEYDYTTKVYTISGTDVQNVAIAIVDKAATDENFKGIFDEFAQNAGTTYDAAISSIKESVSAEFSDWEDAERTIDLNVYYDGEDVKGLSLDEDGVVCKFVVIESDTVEAVDMIVSADEMEMTAQGSVKVEDNKANGSYEYKMTGSGTNVTTTVSMNDVTSSDDKFSGTVSTEFSVTDENGTNTGKVDVTSDSTADNTKLSVDVTANEQKIVTLDYTMTKTEASDVTVPTGTTYNMLDETQLNEYLSSCDVENFKTNLQNALGSDLFDSIEQSAQAAESDISTSTGDYSDYQLSEDDLEEMFGSEYLLDGDVDA